MEREPEQAWGLAGLPATRGQRLTALLLGVLLALLTCLLVPWSERPLPHLPAFLPSLSSITLFADAVTALLLLAQLRRERAPGLAVLAGAYLFNSLIIVPYLLSFPGAFAPGGLLGAGSQATAWLWQCWHASLPLGLLCYIALETRCTTTRLSVRGVRRALALAVALPAVLTVGLTTCLVVWAPLLPPLAWHGHYTPLSTLWLGPGVCVLAALACASIMMRTRGRTVLQVWLGLAALAEFLDVLLGTTGGARYTLGWYTSRLDSLVAAGIALAGVAYAVGHLDAWLVVSEERFRSAFDRSAMGMMMTALDGRFLRVNDAFCHLLGYSRRELLGLTFMEVTHPDDVADNLEGAERVRAGIADSYVSEKRYRRKDGSVIWVSLSVSVMRAIGGAPLHYICQVADITARKKAEETLREKGSELERSNAELQQFAYVASHDLQEPLRTVQSYLGLLRRRYQGQLDADADEFIAYAVDGAARMQSLIRAVLDYSRVGTHGQAFAPTDCAALVERTLETLQTQIAEAGARVEYDGLPTVYGDAGQLAQLFQNLVGNALKFHPPGAAPRVTLASERRGEEWVMSVRDNGIGIDPAYAERIFAMFQRLHTRDEYAGTGIGLAICKRIVERHGGRIWVESQPGHGATFFFTLPAADIVTAADTSNLSAIAEHAA